MTPEQLKNEAKFGARYTLNNLPVAFELRVDNPKSGRLTGNGETRQAVVKSLEDSGKFVVMNSPFDGNIEVTLLGEGSVVDTIQEIAGNSSEIQKIGKKELEIRNQMRRDREKQEEEEEKKSIEKRAADQAAADTLSAKIRTNGMSKPV